MVIVFFGADSKVGTTMLAQSTAEMIAGSREVLFLALNASVISAFADTDIKRIDFFSPEIQSRMRIEKSKITRAGGKKNLFIIGGADDDFKHEEFALDMIDIMVENLRRDFSDIVIDAGSDLKNVLSYSGVMKADMRVLVFSQNGHCIDRMLHESAKWKLLNLGFDAVIVNKYKSLDVLDAYQAVRKLPFTPKEMVRVRYVDMAREAEAEGRTFADYGNKRFLNDLQSFSVCRDERRKKRKKHGKI